MTERVRRKGKMGLLFFPAFDWAISPTHPEREERLLYTKDQIVEEGILDLDEIVEYAPRIASEKDIARVHVCVPDVAAQATEAHRIAAGGALAMADAWRAGEVANGFAIIRPPGHHAMRVVHGNRGFCNVHNEAVMVAYLRQRYGIRRVAIVDTDVHHGDGTQEIYYHDPDVLVIGLHQDGRTLYPGTGFADELGGPGAFARNLNVPLPPGTTDEGMQYVIRELVLPVLADFQPEVVVNSAGQDNHYSDPLACMRVSAQGYAGLNEMLGPDLAVLEGGYSIQSALPYVNLGIILAMAGLDYTHVREPDYDPQALRQSQEQWEVIQKTVGLLQQIWQHRHAFHVQLYPDLRDTYAREKQIFYDTDGIREFQQETVRVCEDCPGWLRIDSRARGGPVGGQRVWAMSIPLLACARCAEEGRAQYRDAVKNPGGPYDWIYLQDRPADEYRRYDLSAEREQALS
jgi:acetoin utilization deacetylase AcuC-like enzyme